MTTLADISQKANLSAATVSHILNNRRGYRPATRERVLRVARELNYQPNFAARSLLRGQTRTLGLYFHAGFAPEPGTVHFTGRLTFGIEQACRESGYDLLWIGATQQSPSDCLRRIDEGRVDGLLLVAMDALSDEAANRLKRSRRVVLIEPSQQLPMLPGVTFDNDAAMDLAVEHLTELGHRKIGFIGSCLDHPPFSSIEREKGYREAMARRGLPINPQWVHSNGTTALRIHHQAGYCEREGALGAQHVLHDAGDDAPTALITYNDLVAVGACGWLFEAGISCPDRCSVMGVDDSGFCRYLRPPLTSIRQPLEEMGRRAARMIIERCEKESKANGGSESDGRHRVGEDQDRDTSHLIRLGPTLVTRQSTGGPHVTP